VNESWASAHRGKWGQCLGLHDIDVLCKERHERFLRSVVDRPLRFSYLSRLAASGALAEFRCGHLTD